MIKIGLFIFLFKTINQQFFNSQNLFLTNYFLLFYRLLPLLQEMKHSLPLQ